MKKYILIAAFSIIMPPAMFTTSCFAERVETKEATAAVRAEQIKQRLEEIKAMDKSALTKAERKELRHEVKDMRDEVKNANHSGLYIALGIVLLVVFLAILVF